MIHPRHLIALLIAIQFASSAGAGTISLRASVRLAPDATQVRLVDIAELTGDDAMALRDVVITELTDATTAIEITVHQVRTKLDDAGVHWGRTSLSGRSVTVRPRRTGQTSPPLPMSSAAVQGAGNAKTESKPVVRHELAADLIDRPSLRGLIAVFMTQGLEVNADDLQLSFDERHADLLDAAPAHVRYEIEPVSNLHASRVDLTVRVWIDGLIDHRRTFSVSPLVRMPVVIVTDEIRRNDVIDERHLRIEHQWMTPAAHGTVHTVSEAVGRHATTRLRVGDMLRSSHLRRETLIRRGEQVIVRCVVGSAVIALQAEARADGSEGDTIEFRKLGERETFLAVVTGRNEAMVDLSR